MDLIRCGLHRFDVHITKTFDHSSVRLKVLGAGSESDTGGYNDKCVTKKSHIYFYVT
jgi:hypothetical protein